MMEFDLIEALRARIHARRGDVALGIGDDAALLEVPDGVQLAACADTMVAGVHFLADTDPADLGWKSLAVNLSDLAAMGAEPAWTLLALTLPDADAQFVDAFGKGFAELAARHRVALVGGDTTQGPLCVTVTALGMVPKGEALTRSGARPGDAVFVTGTLGGAAGALRLLQGDRESHPPRSRFAHVRSATPFLRKGEDEHDPLPQERRPEGPSAQRGRVTAGGCVPGRRGQVQRNTAVELLARLHRPEPRVSAGLALRSIASACVDISDGLLADLGHVARASGVGMEIELGTLPVSAALRATFDEASRRELALAGGDDYELAFSVPENRAEQAARRLAALGCAATRIGHVTEGSGTRVLDADGRAIETPRAGWEHFAQ